MNEISTYRGTRLPALSPALSTAISASGVSVFGKRETPSEREARLKRGDDCPSMVISAGPRIPPSGAVIAEAQRVLPELEASLIPLSQDRLEIEAGRFMDMLNAAVANPQDPDALSMRKAALQLGCSDLPAAVWNRDTLREAMRRFKFFPSVAEIAALLEERAEPLRDRVAQVRIVSRQTAREDVRPREESSPEEKAAIARALAERKAEIEERERREQQVREFGSFMPEGSEGLKGRELADALRRVLPKMRPDMKTITEERIAMLERNADLIEQLQETVRA